MKVLAVGLPRWIRHSAHRRGLKRLPAPFVPLLLMLTMMVCAGCQATLVANERPTGADVVTAAAEYLGSMGAGTCGDEGWSAAFVTNSEGTLRTAITCGSDISVAEVLVETEAPRDPGPPGASVRRARVSIANEREEEGLDAARSALERALELSEDCMDEEGHAVSETNVDDAGRTIEIRIECGRP